MVHFTFGVEWSILCFFFFYIFQRLKSKRPLSETKKFNKTKNALFQGISNYGSRKKIWGLQNKLAFCALCRETLRIPGVPRNFYLFYFVLSIFILLTRRKATEALMHRVGNYPNLLPEMPRYWCPLVI